MLPDFFNMYAQILTCCVVNDFFSKYIVDILVVVNISIRTGLLCVCFFILFLGYVFY